MGESNHTSLSLDLPSFHQHIKYATRGGKTLDHYCSPIKNAHHATARAPLGVSDHAMIQLIPAYRQKLKAVRSGKNPIKTWTIEAIEELCSVPQTGMVLNQVPTVWMSIQTQSHLKSASVRKIVSPIKPLPACPITNFGSMCSSDSCARKKEEGYRTGDKEEFKKCLRKLSK